jgi:hypothetical protein
LTAGAAAVPRIMTRPSACAVFMNPRLIPGPQPDKSKRKGKALGTIRNIS